MSFFGLTTLGNGNFFAHNAMRKMEIHNISEEKWVEAYQSVGLSPEDAFELQVDRLTNLARGDLPRVLAAALGRDPTSEESQTFVIYVDVDTSGIITIEEFMRGVLALRASVGTPVSGVRYTSNLKVRGPSPQLAAHSGPTPCPGAALSPALHLAAGWRPCPCCACPRGKAGDLRWPGGWASAGWRVGRGRGTR
mmetsp:Transcript_50539/g.161672  ORF Transcript_50539/g.161672 Transcript_50539/m.161672 type:complete len:194 (-) Transcript_50539:204-785(-)